MAPAGVLRLERNRFVSQSGPAVWSGSPISSRFNSILTEAVAAVILRVGGNDLLGNLLLRGDNEGTLIRSDHSTGLSTSSFSYNIYATGDDHLAEQLGAEISTEQWLSGWAPTDWARTSSPETYLSIVVDPVSLRLNPGSIAHDFVLDPQVPKDADGSAADAGAIPALSPVAIPAASISQVSLAPAVPNPAASAVEFGLQLERDSQTRVGIYDLRGRVVRTLFAGALPMGGHSFNWDTRDDRGHTVASGAYFLRVSTEAGTGSSKVLVVR